MDECAAAFEQMLYKLKKPFLDNTDVNNNQQVQEVKQQIDDKIQEIYNSLLTIINTIVSKRNESYTPDGICDIVNESDSALCMLMQQDNVAFTLYENAGFEETLLARMKSILMEYPYSQTSGHTTALQKIPTLPGTPHTVNNTIPIE